MSKLCVIDQANYSEETIEEIAQRVPCISDDCYLYLTIDQLELVGDLVTKWQPLPVASGDMRDVQILLRRAWDMAEIYNGTVIKAANFEVVEDSFFETAELCQIRLDCVLRQ